MARDKSGSRPRAGSRGPVPLLRHPEHRGDRADGRGHALVPGAQRRGPLLGGADRAGRHPQLRGVVPRRWVRAVGGHRGRLVGLRCRAARAGRGDQPPADRRPGAALDRGGRGERRRAARPARRARGARRRAALRTGGRVRDRRGLCPGRGGARCLGCPARGPRGRRGAARGGRRDDPVAGQCGRLGRPRPGGRRSGDRAQRAHGDRSLRRGTPGGQGRGHGRAVRGAGRPAGGAARRRQRLPRCRRSR